MILVLGEKLKKEDLMESILTSIKKMLGIIEECTDFDVDIIIHINTALGILSQIGAGPSNGFSISDKTSVWTDFIGDQTNLEFVKTYVYLKVKMVFDPPASSSMEKTYKEMISELESRISVVVD